MDNKNTFKIKILNPGFPETFSVSNLPNLFDNATSKDVFDIIK
jgi:hypothetical protein